MKYLIFFFALLLITDNLSYCQVQDKQLLDTTFSVTYARFYTSFDTGYIAFQNKMYTKAYENMLTVMVIHDMYSMDDLEKVTNRKQFDSMATEAMLIYEDCKDKSEVIKRKHDTLH